jgi:hypothetical protein
MLKKGTWKNILGIKIPLPYIRQQEPLLKIGNRVLLYKYKLPRRTPWNATQFRKEHGATNTHVAVDIMQSLGPLLIGLIILAAVQKSSEEDK